MLDRTGHGLAVVLRVLGLVGVIGGLGLLWQLGQPIAPRARPALVREALLLLAVFAVILTLLAVFVNGWHNLRHRDDNSPYLNWPLIIISLGLVALGLAGLVLAGFRFARVVFTYFRGWWLERRVARLDARYDPEAVGQSVRWYLEGLRMLRQGLRLLFVDLLARGFSLIALFLLGLGFAVSQLLLLLAIPFLVLSLARRGLVGAICVAALLVYFAGMFVTGGLSQDDLWSERMTAGFLTDVSRNEALMFYRFALFMLIVAAAITLFPLVWVPVGGTAFGALLYLFIEEWPCLPILRDCTPDLASAWGYPVIGVLAFAGLHAGNVLFRLKAAKA